MRRLVPLALLLAACHRGEPRMLPFVAGGDPDRAPAHIREFGCGSCHVIPGVPGARGLVGPPLTDFASRGYVAGALVNEPENLVRWIVNPQAIEPGTAMPTLGVSEQQARDIAAYLYQVGAPGGLGPPHLLSRRVIGSWVGGE